MMYTMIGSTGNRPLVPPTLQNTFFVKGPNPTIDISSANIQPDDFILVHNHGATISSYSAAVVDNNGNQFIQRFNLFGNDQEDFNYNCLYRFAEGNETSLTLSGMSSSYQWYVTVVQIWRSVDKVFPFDVPNVVRQTNSSTHAYFNSIVTRTNRTSVISSAACVVTNASPFLVPSDANESLSETWTSYVSDQGGTYQYERAHLGLGYTVLDQPSSYTHAESIHSGGAWADTDSFGVLMALRAKQEFPTDGSIFLAGFVTSKATNPTLSLEYVDLEAGDFILVLQTSYVIGNPTIAAQDNNAVSLTTLYDLYGDDTQDHNTAAFYKIADGTETSITLSGSSGYDDSTVVMVLRNVDNTTPFDVTTVTQNNNSTNNAIIPDITTVTDNAFVITIGATSTSTTYSTDHDADYAVPSLANTALSNTWTTHRSTSGSRSATMGLGWAQVATAGLYSVGTASHAGSSTAYDSHGIQIALRRA